MKMSNLATKKVLDITQQCYEEYKSRLIVLKPLHMFDENMSLKQFVELGLNDPDKKLNLQKEEKDKLQAYITSGVLDETEEVPDWEVAKEYEAELDKRLLKAIDDGILPKYTLTILKKKTRKYARKIIANNK